MPLPKKFFEITLEIKIDKVSCPGVWLCQDGNVSLTLFTFATTVQSWQHPPAFPLRFNESFHFKRRLNHLNALSEVNALLVGEPFYCELIQWSPNYESGKVLAQYLGHLGEMLFPSSTCASSGIDLLMKATTHYPGIIAPKIEMTTKVRVDQVFEKRVKSLDRSSISRDSRHLSPTKGRQQTVCHSQDFHKSHCCTQPTLIDRSLFPNQPHAKHKSKNAIPSTKSRDLSGTQTPKSNPTSCSRPRSRSTTKGDSFSDNIEIECLNLSDICNMTENTSLSRDPPSSGQTESSERTNKRNPSILKSKPLHQAIGRVPTLRWSNGVDLRPKKHHSETSLDYDLCTCNICQRYHELFHCEGPL